MTDTSFSPAPLVEQALQSLRDKAAETTPAARREAARRAKADAKDEANPATVRTKAVAKPHAKRKPAHTEHNPPQVTADEVPTQLKPDQSASVEPATLSRSDSVSLDSALGALRSLSVSAQTRLADPENFPDLPLERDLSDLGPYVEHVMREAQASATAYRQKSERETTVRAAKLLGAAAASAEKIRQDADIYGERALAQADALLAERVHRIAELTGHLSQMAQLAGDELADGKVMRDQMMQFISALTAMAEETITDLFPKTPAGSDNGSAAGHQGRHAVS